MSIKIEPLPKYEDHRGFLSSIFKKSYCGVNFVEDRISFSTKNVLRGMHGDHDTFKLIVVLKGKVEFLAQKLDGSDSLHTILDANRPTSILLPPGYINGHYCISDDCLFYYKWSEYYDDVEQYSVHWRDKDLVSKFLATNPVLSERDKEAGTLKELHEKN